MLLALAGCQVATAPPAALPEEHVVTLVSQSYHIDRLYPSMTGPSSVENVDLWPADRPELLWITGYRTTVVDAETQAPLSQEWMCHANLDFEPVDYAEIFPTAPPLSGRVFTLSQGQQDIHFPPGFGIPITNDTPLQLVTQVLNLNVEAPDLRVRHVVEIRFLRDLELTTPMVALFQAAAEGMKAIDEARAYGVAQAEFDQDEHGLGCSVGSPALAGDFDVDSHGQRFSAHWEVPPGREVNATNATRFLSLPYDTRAHAIAVHLHPWAESLTLRDLTTGTDLFTARVTPSEGRVGIDRVDAFESVEGMQLHKGHEYEVVSVYDNKSGKSADSMAVFYLYLADRDFVKPDLDRPLRARTAPASTAGM
jgi:hypothetical protein